MSATAASLLVGTLRRHGVDRIFCVPGESFLPVLDALYDATDIDLITCRHESGAGLMAVADAKLTARPGTVFVSRGPGSSNVTIAVHTAEQDGVPVVFFVGQVERKDLGRRAFQEVDYTATYADMAKLAVEVRDGATLATVTRDAYRLAQTGTPGPVVVSLPEDMLAESVDGAPADPEPKLGGHAAEAADVDAVAQRLAAAERPLVIAGGLIASVETRQALEEWSHRWRVPVALSYKHQDVFTNDHPSFAGYLGYGLPDRAWTPMAEADLVVAIGARLNDITTQGYRFPRAPQPRQPLVHVHPDPAQLGRVFSTDLEVVADIEPFVRALASRSLALPALANRRRVWCERLHGASVALARWRPDDEHPNDGVDFGEVVAALARHAPADAILTMDAGNFGSWVHRHFPFRSTHRLLGAVSGAMGLGVPAAVAAARRYPGRQVLTVVGDGGMLMTGQELATAVQYDAPVRIFVANNNSYATIRLQQEKAYPGRAVGTDLRNPDFAALAAAFGATGLTIRESAEVDSIVEAALGTAGPVVVDIRTSLERISAYSRLSALAGGPARTPPAS